MEDKKELKRTLSLFSLTLYGVGSIIGAGIYVITGKVAAQAGMLTPTAFLFSALIAAFSAMSFAELSSRYPQSAGEAIYVRAAFNKKLLTNLVGWLVILTGMISTGALANGFVGYLHLFFAIPRSLVITIFVLALGGLAIWGIRESVIVIVVITIIELAGLLLVVALASTHANFDLSNFNQLIPRNMSSWENIILGSFIAFYAFIGLEDIVNVAEEVIEPKKNVALSILLSVLISSILYILVSVAAVIILTTNELANSKAPMATIVEKAGYSTTIIGIIGLITVINGALVNIIMATRVIYGMSKIKSLPIIFSKVHPFTQTPHLATLLVIFITLFLALLLPIATLAQITSYLMLIVYFFINLALLVLKVRNTQPQPVISFPIIFPVMGIITTILLMAFQTFSWVIKH